jgi:hypothetical protein
MGVSGQRHAPAALYPRGKDPRWGWVGPRAVLDAETRRKIFCPCRGSNPDRPARSQTLTELPRLHIDMQYVYEKLLFVEIFSVSVILQYTIVCLSSNLHTMALNMSTLHGKSADTKLVFLDKKRWEPHESSALLPLLNKITAIL